MYRCELCITILQERYKTKHNPPKKHRFYSNLIINRYVVKNVEENRFKDVLNPYFTAHTRKFVFFTVSDLLGNYDREHPLNHKINVSNYIT